MDNDIINEIWDMENPEASEFLENYEIEEDESRESN